MKIQEKYAKQESITTHPKRMDNMVWYDCPIDYRKPFRHVLGNKPHSHMWGRKPSWRAKRKASKLERSKTKATYEVGKGQRYMYIGKDTESHKHGVVYRVVETGPHYYKEFGHCIWMSVEDFGYVSNDIDLCTSWSPDMFHQLFWRV